MPRIANRAAACRKIATDPNQGRKHWNDLAVVLTGPDRRQKLDVKIKADKELAAAEFDKLDEHLTGQIDLQQFRHILSKVNNGEELDLAAWSFIVVSLIADANSSAPAAQDTDDVTLGQIIQGSEPSVKITQAAALLAVTKYSYYVAHNQDVDKIFRKFDRDKSGDWDRHELKRAMVFSENQQGMKRSAAGVVLDISVFDEDVTFVLQKLGFPANGKIDSRYAQQALATWHARADGNFERQSKCCCSIM